MTIEQAFGIVLRRLRREHNITQEKLSVASKLDRSFLSNIEGGKQQPSLISIFAIASALHVTPSSIIQESELILKIHRPELFTSEADKWEFDWVNSMNTLVTDDFGNFKGRETILVVDDDHQLRNMLSSLLVNYGYKVMEAHNGQDAIHLYNNHADAIHLILMDVAMPKKDGFTAYREIKALNPNAKIIIMSGYHENHPEKPVNALIVNKPFSPLEIIQVIKNAILSDESAACHA